MVTGLSSTEQTAYLSASNNTKKANTQGETVNISRNTIEDTYTPSFDIKGTGSEFYSNKSDVATSLNRPDSIEGFTNGLKMQIVQDYNKQHPETSAYSEMGDFGNKHLMVISKTNDGFLGAINNTATDSLKSYLESIDYKKEYEEYKQSRGCSTDEEIQALNRAGAGMQTKEDLVNWTKTQLTSPNFQIDLSSCGINTGQKYLEGVFTSDEANKVSSNIDLGTMADYFNANLSAQNFKEQVSAFQSFIDKASTSNGLDDELKGKMTGLSKQITQASDVIEEFSQKREEEIAARHNITQYNASLIANYAS